LYRYKPYATLWFAAVKHGIFATETLNTRKSLRMKASRYKTLNSRTVPAT